MLKKEKSIIGITLKFDILEHKSQPFSKVIEQMGGSLELEKKLEEGCEYVKGKT